MIGTIDKKCSINELSKAQYRNLWLLVFQKCNENIKSNKELAEY